MSDIIGEIRKNRANCTGEHRQTSVKQICKQRIQRISLCVWLLASGRSRLFRLEHFEFTSTAHVLGGAKKRFIVLIMERNLPGFIWCPTSKRYYRAPPEASTSFVNLPSVPDPNAGKQDELEKKIVQTHHALNDLEIGPQRKSSAAKFNAYDSLLASRFTSDNFKFNRNIFIENLLNFRGARLADPVCQHLAALPARDLLVGVWKNESSCTVSQMDIKGLLAPSSSSYRLVSTNNIGNFQTFVIDQILPVTELGNFFFMIL